MGKTKKIHLASEWSPVLGVTRQFRNEFREVWSDSQIWQTLISLSSQFTTFASFFVKKRPPSNKYPDPILSVTL